MGRVELVQKLQELARVAYWYGERTGDYNMTSLFEDDDEAALVAEQIVSGVQDVE